MDDRARRQSSLLVTPIARDTSFVTVSTMPDQVTCQLSVRVTKLGSLSFHIERFLGLSGTLLLAHVLTCCTPINRMVDGHRITIVHMSLLTLLRYMVLTKDQSLAQCRTPAPIIGKSDADWTSSGSALSTSTSGWISHEGAHTSMPAQAVLLCVVFWLSVAIN